MKDALMTSIVLKPGITLLDIVSTRMLGQVGFMASIFDIFNSNGISVDVVATSEVSISLTLDPRYVLPSSFTQHAASCSWLSGGFSRQLSSSAATHS